MEPKNILLEMKDYIIEMGAETINWCMQCGLCTNLCPWRLVPGQTSEEFNIRHMQRLGQMGIEGFEDENMLFACSTCGMCQNNCPRGVKIIDNVRAMRASIVGGGMPPAGLRPILGSCPRKRKSVVRPAREKDPVAGRPGHPQVWTGYGVFPLRLLPFMLRPAQHEDRAKHSAASAPGRRELWSDRGGRKLLRREHAQDRRRGTLPEAC